MAALHSDESLRENCQCLLGLHFESSVDWTVVCSIQVIKAAITILSHSTLSMENSVCPSRNSVFIVLISKLL